MTDSNGDNVEPAPKVLGKEALRQPLPRRFYKAVTVAPSGEPSASGFRILLDGRAVKTPKKLALVLPTGTLARAVAEEWSAQGERIDPETMPFTRLANTAIDAVAPARAAVAADIVAYAGSDLLCYRAQGPPGLVAKQSAAWDPLLAWARDGLGVRLRVVPGVVHIEQDESELARIARSVALFDAFALSALHVMTTMSGSAILALACALGHLSPDAAWAAAHVDEDWQISQWGQDWEAQGRRENRAREFTAAAKFLELAAGR